MKKTTMKMKSTTVGKVNKRVQIMIIEGARRIRSYIDIYLNNINHVYYDSNIVEEIYNFISLVLSYGHL